MKTHELIVRASSMGALMTTNRSVTLTEKQAQELNDLSNKIKLTDKQSDRLLELRSKRDAKPELSETAKREIEKYVLLNKYGIEQNISTWQMEKGILNESEGLKIASRVLGWMDTENVGKIRLINDYVTGEPDVWMDDVLADIKCSADGTTFPWFDKNINSSYYAQLQTYMWLSNTNTSFLVYVLTNTPEHIIYDLAKRESFKIMTRPENQNKTIEEIETEVEDYLRSQHNFDHIPEEKRVKCFEIERNDSYIDKMKEQISLAREYYDAIFNQI